MTRIKSFMIKSNNPFSRNLQLKYKKKKVIEHVEFRHDTVPITPQQKTSTSKNSSMLDKMRNKLDSAKFRWLNEQMYTTTGKESHEMFKNDPELFSMVQNNNF